MLKYISFGKLIDAFFNVIKLKERGRKVTKNKKKKERARERYGTGFILAACN